jgi:hypothetical protein
MGVNMSVYGWIGNALTAARHESVGGEGASLPLGALHARRSKRFVDNLAKAMQARYRLDDHRTFWRQNPNNAKDFGLNEFLYDISVVQIRYLQSSTLKRSIPFVSRFLWCVESEFSNNERNIVCDFSKLVMSSAENKLFVCTSGPAASTAKRLANLAQAAQCCTGDIWLAFVPHPATWASGGTAADSKEFSVHHFTDLEWALAVEGEPESS